VTVVPPGVEILGYTSKCRVHGMSIPNKLITIQGHPEFKEQIMREILVLRHSTGIIDDELFEDATSRTSKPCEGVYVAKAFLELFIANQSKIRSVKAGP
jgi:hypothetical protein